MAVPLNLLAVLGSVVALMALGFLWFGPLFGKAWMKESGVTPEQAEVYRKDPAMKKRMMKSYALMGVGSLLMVFTLAHNLVFGSAYLHMNGVAAGLQAGFWNWLGFVVPVSMGSVLWENKTWKWWIITAGYYLVALLLTGVILALWRA